MLILKTCEYISLIWRKYKTEILIFCLGFGVRFVYAVIIQLLAGSKGFIAYSDAEVFLREAKNLLHHGVISQMPAEPFVPDSLRTPLYFYFLIPFLWLKIPLLGIVLAQNIFAGLINVFIYRIGKKLFNSGIIGIIAAVLLSFEPVSIYWNNLLMSDNLSIFLLIFSLHQFVNRKIYSSVVLLALSVLARPIGLYFLPLFLAMLVLQFRVSWKKVLLASLLFLIILFPWMLRNKMLFNTWELSSAGWLNLNIFTLAGFARQQNISLPMPVMPRDYPGQNAVVFSYDFANVPFYKSSFFNTVLKYPLEYIKFHFASMIKGFNNHDYAYLMNYVIRVKIPAVSRQLGDFLVGFGKGIWLLIYAMIFIGLLKGKNLLWQLFFVLFVVLNSFLLGYSGIDWGGRYFLPVMPIIFLLGSNGLFIFYKLIIGYVRHKRI